MIKKKTSPAASEPVRKKAPASNSKYGDLKSRITPVAELPLFISALFYGRPGTGKTTLAASFPDALLLDIKEKGTDSVADVSLDVLKIESWDDFEKAYWLLKSGDHGYKTVVIDAITQLQDLAIEEVANGGTVSKRDWGEVGGMMKSWLTDYRDLTEQGIHVVFLAHDRSTDTEDGDDGELTPDVGPRLMPSVASVVCGAVKVLGNTFIREKVNKLEGGKITREPEYCLRLGPHAHFLTKIRQPKSSYVPPYLSDPNYDQIISIIKGEYPRPGVPSSTIKRRKGK